MRTAKHGKAMVEKLRCKKIAWYVIQHNTTFKDSREIKIIEDRRSTLL
jgi:hypothetical protein